MSEMEAIRQMFSARDTLMNSTRIVMEIAGGRLDNSKPRIYDVSPGILLDVRDANTERSIVVAEGVPESDLDQVVREMGTWITSTFPDADIVSAEILIKDTESPDGWIPLRRVSSDREPDTYVWLHVLQAPRPFGKDNPDRIHDQLIHLLGGEADLTKEPMWLASRDGTIYFATPITPEAWKPVRQP